MVANLIFGGVSAADYGAIVDGSNTYGAPERDVTTIEVPGRNGTLTMDNGRYANISIQYTLYFRQQHQLEAYRQTIIALQGYQRLEDGRHPEEYRIARLEGGFTPQMSDVFNRRGSVDITFDCKPQRYLKQGELEIPLAKSGAVLLNEWMPSLPLITVKGSKAGTLTINGVTVTFKSTFSGPVILDCDLQDAYSGTQNRNAQISAPVFPTLPHGRCTISWTGGVTGVTIVPRWWTL